MQTSTHMDIYTIESTTQFPSIQFPQIDEINIKLLLLIDDVNMIKALYETSKNYFANHLNTPFILNRLKTKFGVEKYTINNFGDLLEAYECKIGSPPQFDSFSTDEKLPPELIWDKEKKDSWLTKVYIVQNSNLIKKSTNGRTMLIGDQFQLERLYNHPSTNSCWSDGSIMMTKSDIITPSEQMYDLINKLYLQLKKI